MTDLEILSRAVKSPAGIAVRGHYTALESLRRRLSAVRRSDRQTYNHLVFSLRSDKLIITNGNGLKTALEEIFP